MQPAGGTSRQRLRWQCRRGMLELDYILEDYLEQHYPADTAELKAAFEALLQEQDPDLQAWLLQGQPAPSRYQAILRSLRAD